MLINIVISEIEFRLTENKRLCIISENVVKYLPNFLSDYEICFIKDESTLNFINVRSIDQVSTDIIMNEQEVRKFRQWYEQLY
jgi:hypothetical protein